jgi:hypothetical protein
MGITDFYSQFKKLFPNSINRNVQYDIFEAIAFDLNQWIHRNLSAFFMENNDIHNEASIQEFALYCFFYIKQYIFNNSITLIVVLDGPCPFPKLKEQKRRRYLRKQDNNHNQITIGSFFMHYFSNFLYYNLLNLVRSKQCKAVYFSSHQVIGEGEHKIIDLIKLTKLKTLIISIDADCILLCILNNIKEASILRTHKNYTDIIDMQCVLKDIENPLNFFINVLLMGNDFLPKIQSKISNFLLVENEDFSHKLLGKDNCTPFDIVKCQNYLTYMYWIILYYKKPYYHDKIPLCDNPEKISLKELQQFCYENESFIPKMIDTNTEHYSIKYQYNFLYDKNVNENIDHSLKKCVRITN